MTRLLIVDDDPGQLRMLARILAVRQRDLSVVTAGNGHEAVELLRSVPVDLVLTDLQMPEMNGFELLAWLLANRPHIPAFTMTAYPDAESVGRLRELGSIECFTKPLDVPNVLERLSQAMTEDVRGHVRNISLTSFLQLVQMDRKTCTLAIESGGRTGYIYMHEGGLLGAKTRNIEGDAAAIEIISWPSPAITIMGTRGTPRHSTVNPLPFLLMEAMRLRDEAERAAAASATVVSVAAAPVAETEPASMAEAMAEPAAEESDPDPIPPPAASGLAPFCVRMPTDADALAIVETASGYVRSSAGRGEGLSELAKLAAAVLRAEAATVTQLGLHDEIHELVLTTPRCWTVIRPVPTDTFAMLVFDPHRVTLAMERREMDGLLGDLQAWHEDSARLAGGDGSA